MAGLFYEHPPKKYLASRHPVANVRAYFRPLGRLAAKTQARLIYFFIFALCHLFLPGPAIGGTVHSGF